MPPKKNHIHIPANPVRVKAEEIITRHKKRKEKVPQEITNEMLYEMLIDILDRQEILEKKLDHSLKVNGVSPLLGPRSFL